jgi:hypothetical protein
LNPVKCQNGDVKNKKSILKLTKMKNLLKISCVLAIALFVSMSVKAQEVRSAGGTITVSVPDQLALAVTGEDFTLSYYQNGTSPNVLTNSAMTYDVNANVAWDLNIKGSGNPDVMSKLKFGIDGAATIAITTDDFAAKVSNMDRNEYISWELENLGNFAAGTYPIEVTYTLVKHVN